MRLLAALIGAVVACAAAPANAVDYFIVDYGMTVPGTGLKLGDKVEFSNPTVDDGYYDERIHFFTVAPTIKVGSLLLQSPDASAVQYRFQNGSSYHDQLSYSTNSVDPLSFGLANGVRLGVSSFSFDQNVYFGPRAGGSGNSITLSYILSNGGNVDLLLGTSLSAVNIGQPVGGEVTPELPVPAVPETGTWAMMLIGFAAIGHVIRRRSRLTAPQVAA